MRNITAFAGLVIILWSAHTVFAQDKQPYSLAVSTQFGFIYGQAEEIVYPSSEYKAELLSQLLWDMKPVYYYGLLLDFGRTQPMEKWGFFSALSLKNGIPGISGNMEDRDWLSKENDALTCYSIHDNTTDKLLLFDISAGVSIPLNRILLLKTYINVSYMYFNFSGINGHGIYGYDRNSKTYHSIENEPLVYEDYSGRRVINYTQEWFCAAPCVSLRLYIFRNFFTELSFAISPLVYCVDNDQHLTTHNEYQDYMRGGFLFEPELYIAFIATKWLEFSLECSWRYIRGTRGETYFRSPIGSGYYFQNGEAGAGLSMIDASLGIKIHF
jgi:outer membrane protease